MIGHYLMFNGNCSEALVCYKSAFDAEIIEMQQYGDMPPNPDFPVSDAQKNLVLHARFTICGTEIMCADAHARSEPGSNMYVSISSTDGAYVQKAWDELKAGGKIYMALTPSFFAAAHGTLQDRFGVNWMFTVMK